MKKLLFVLLLCFFCSAMYAQQVRTSYSGNAYANGDSFGFSIDEIPGAVSYVWSAQGSAGAVVWPADWTDKAVDITFSYPGICDVICTVTMSDGTVEEYALSVDVYEE